MTAIADLVRQSTTSTGTGNLTLSSVSGFQTFNAAFGSGATTNVFYYFIIDVTNNAWERGTGHMSNSTTLVRDTVTASTNSNAHVNFLGGTLVVLNDLPAEMQVPYTGATASPDLGAYGIYGNNWAINPDGSGNFNSDISWDNAGNLTVENSLTITDAPYDAINISGTGPRFSITDNRTFQTTYFINDDGYDGTTFKIYDGNYNTLCTNQNGGVGINNTSPQYALDIYNAGGLSQDIGNSTNSLWAIGSDGSAYFSNSGVYIPPGGGIQAGTPDYDYQFFSIQDGIAYIGDYNGSANDTLITVNDLTTQIMMQGQVYAGPADYGYNLFSLQNGGYAFLGDYNVYNNGTNIGINDPSEIIDITANNNIGLNTPLLNLPGGFKFDDSGNFTTGNVSTDNGTTKWTFGAHTSGTKVQSGYVAITINGTSYNLLTG